VPHAEWTDEHWREAAEYVKACEPFIDLLRQGAAAPRYSLDPAWHDGPDVAIVTVPLAQMASEVLECKALLDAREGRTGQVADTLSLLLDVADRQERWSTLTYGVRLTVYRIVAELVRDVVDSGTLDADAILSAVGPHLAAIEDPHLLSDALRGERFLGLWVLENLIEPRAGVFGKRRALQDACGYLDAMQGLIELAHEEYAPARPRVAAIIEGAYGDHARGDLGILGLPRHVDAFVERTWTIAVTRVTLLGLQALAYRRETGNWPEDLPSPLNDPFGNGPLRYERLPDGVRLSSCAPAEEAHWDTVTWELR
jgi:hypothetical protein